MRNEQGIDRLARWQGRLQDVRQAGEVAADRRPDETGQTDTDIRIRRSCGTRGIISLQLICAIPSRSQPVHSGCRWDVAPPCWRLCSFWISDAPQALCVGLASQDAACGASEPRGRPSWVFGRGRS